MIIGKLLSRQSLMPSELLLSRLLCLALISGTSLILRAMFFFIFLRFIVLTVTFLVGFFIFRLFFLVLLGFLLFLRLTELRLPLASSDLISDLFETFLVYNAFFFLITILILINIIVVFGLAIRASNAEGLDGSLGFFLNFMTAFLVAVRLSNLQVFFFLFGLSLLILLIFVIRVIIVSLSLATTLPIVLLDLIKVVVLLINVLGGATRISVGITSAAVSRSILVENVGATLARPVADQLILIGTHRGSNALLSGSLLVKDIHGLALLLLLSLRPIVV